jgi:hypothetical protein
MILRLRSGWPVRVPGSLLALALASACSCGGSEPETAPPETSERESSGAATERAEATATPGPSEPVTTAAAPELELTTTVDAYARVSLAVVNRSGSAQRLSAALVLERAEGDRYAAAELGSFSLGAELATDGCVELAPGAELRGTWSCLRAESVGAVRDCSIAPAGRYRFVAQACGGSARTEAEPFEYAR